MSKSTVIFLSCISIAILSPGISANENRQNSQGVQTTQPVVSPVPPEEVNQLPLRPTVRNLGATTIPFLAIPSRARHSVDTRPTDTSRSTVVSPSSIRSTQSTIGRQTQAPQFDIHRSTLNSHGQLLQLTRGPSEASAQTARDSK